MTSPTCCSPGEDGLPGWSARRRTTRWVPCSCCCSASRWRTPVPWCLPRRPHVPRHLPRRGRRDRADPPAGPARGPGHRDGAGRDVRGDAAASPHLGPARDPDARGRRAHRHAARHRRRDRLLRRVGPADHCTGRAADPCGGPQHDSGRGRPGPAAPANDRATRSPGGPCPGRLGAGPDECGVGAATTGSPEMGKAGDHRCEQWPPAFSPTRSPAFRQDPGGRGGGIFAKCKPAGKRHRFRASAPGLHTNCAEFAHAAATATARAGSHACCGVWSGSLSRRLPGLGHVDGRGRPTPPAARPPS